MGAIHPPWWLLTSSPRMILQYLVRSSEVSVSVSPILSFPFHFLSPAVPRRCAVPDFVPAKDGPRRSLKSPRSTPSEIRTPSFPPSSQQHREAGSVAFGSPAPNCRGAGRRTGVFLLRLPIDNPSALPNANRSVRNRPFPRVECYFDRED